MQKKKKKKRKEEVKKALRRTMKDIRFSFTAKTIYEDNLYKTHDSQVNAFINSLDIDLQYNPKFIWRKGHTAIGLRIKGGPDTNVTKRGVFTKGKGGFKTLLTHTRDRYAFALNFGLDKDYSATTEIKTGAILPTSLIDYWKRSYGASLLMDFRRLPTEIVYTHSDTLYTKRYASSNTSKDEVSLTNHFKVFPKTSLLSSFDYTVENSPKRPQARIVSYTFWTGIKGRISPKVDGLVKAGYKISNPKGTPRTTTETLGLNLEYQMFRRLLHNLSLERNLESTAYAEEAWVRKNKFAWDTSYLPPWSRNLRLGAGFTFTDYDYSSFRRDDKYELYLKTTYSLKNKLTLSLRYDFEYNDSNILENDYKSRRVSLEISKEF